ncbi:MAG TPA: hypothetical protein VMA31_09815 [Bryobacteraceae bacterium]|nr:hypothetical protein [Bryobacteraceae bacterium]
MKTNLLRMSAVAALAAAAVFAQNPVSVKVDVPFRFVVGSQPFAAGEYVVSQGPTDASVMISPAQGTRVGVHLANPLYSHSREARPRLVFHRYGHTYFLSEIWGGSANGRRIPETNRERESARTWAASEVVILAANR